MSARDRFVDVVVIALATIAWFYVNGYTFGQYDHAIHLAYLLRAVDPSFLQRDILVAASAHHPSLFWVLQAPFVRLFPLEGFYYTLHVLSVAAMFAGAMALTRAISPPAVARTAALVTPLMLIGVRTTLAAIPYMDNHVLNRTVTIGALLFALALGARQKFAVAFLVAGLAFNIHPTTASHAVVLLMTAALFDRERRWRSLARVGFVLVGAFPLLAVVATGHSGSGVPYPPPRDWFELQRLLLFFHHFPSLWPPRTWLALAGPMVVVALFLRSMRSSSVVAYIAGVVLVCLAGFVGNELLRIPLFIQLHLLESSRFLEFIAASCAAAWVAHIEPWRARPSWRARIGAWSGLAAIVGFALPIVYLAIAAGIVSIACGTTAPESGEARPLPRWVIAIAMLPIALAGHNLLPPNEAPKSLHPRPLMPWEQYRPTFAELEAAPVMFWCRDHLPEDALVVIPPRFGIPIASFRYGARRAVFATMKDGSETTFNLDYSKAWRHRIEAVCACRPFDESPAPFRGSDAFIHMMIAVSVGYAGADAARMRSLAAEFGVTHAVTQTATPPLALPLLYEDDGYRVYRIDP